MKKYRIAIQEFNGKKAERFANYMFKGKIESIDRVKSIIVKALNSNEDLAMFNAMQRLEIKDMMTFGVEMNERNLKKYIGATKEQIELFLENN